jgi:protein disulfide-isomerase
MVCSLLGIRPNMADSIRVLLRKSSQCQKMTLTRQTSKPAINIKSSLDSQSSLNSFHPYYNFHFASLNCVAYGDACQRHNVNSFPQMLLYKDGELFKKFTGVKDMEGVSSFIEDTLEAIRPGSRPAGGLKLPEVGATGVDTEAIPDVILSKDKNIAAGESMGATHNEKASATKYQQHPESTAVGNLIGTSVPLSAESFQSLVTTTQDPWFIKFYAPWCHHCQAMAPNWAQLGKEMKGKLNIGEVNCDAETRLCKDVKLRGYPTILFFRGGERVEYDGLRGLGDLVSFAKKAIEVGDGVKRVNELDFVEMEKTEEVIFVYFYDHATTAEDFAAIERLTLSLIGHAKIVKTDDKNLAKRFKISTWPRLLVSRDGRPSYYTALAPKDMREYRRVLSWMKTVWLPIVPELTASNSREIMDGRIVVLGILTRDKDSDFISAKREIKNAALEWMEKQTLTFQLERQELRDAKKLRIEEAEDRGDQRALRAAKSIRVNMNEHDRKEVGFAWVDGVFWERWIRTTYGFEVKDGERVVINDEDVSFSSLSPPR